MLSFKVNSENVDFYWTMLQFWMNLVLESGTLNKNHLAHLQAKAEELKTLHSGTPITMFQQHLLPHYKTVDT